MQANASEGRKLKAALALRFNRIPSSLLLEPVFVFTLVRIAFVQDTRLHTYRVLYEVILPMRGNACSRASHWTRSIAGSEFCATRRFAACSEGTV